METVQGHWWVCVLGSGAGGTTSLTRNVMLGARDCHSTRRRSAGNAGRVPRRTCAQCGGMWGTRLDALVSPGANLEGAELEVSPGQEGWRGPPRTAAIARKSGRIAPLRNSHRDEHSLCGRIPSLRTSLLHIGGATPGRHFPSAPQTVAGPAGSLRWRGRSPCPVSIHDRT